MLIGLLSDSHDRIPNAQTAVKKLKNQNVQTVLHAGDFCSPFMVPIFKEFDLHAVFGNNDGDVYLLMEKMREIGGTFHGDFFEQEFDGLRLAMYHGTHPEITDALIHCGKYDAVVSGHTHKVVEEEVNGTLVINPGSVHGFHHQATMGVLDTSDKSLNIVTIN